MAYILIVMMEVMAGLDRDTPPCPAFPNGGRLYLPAGEHIGDPN